MIIRIIARNTEDATRKWIAFSNATWIGNLAWASIPSPDCRWAHCGEWASEKIRNVTVFGPNKNDDDPDCQIEIFTETEAIEHLKEKHGFE